MQNMQDGRPVIVTEPVMRPNHCALAPQISRDPEGFIDTGVKLPGVAPRVYVSIGAFRDLARRLGFFSAEQHAESLERIAELEREGMDKDARIAELEGVVDAYGVLKAAGRVTPVRATGARAKAAA